MDEMVNGTNVSFMACLQNRVVYSDLIVWRLSLTGNEVVDGVISDGYFDIKGHPMTVKLKKITGTYVEVPWTAIQTIHIHTDLRKVDSHG